MTTCREVVSKGLNMARIVRVGRAPSGAEASLGMDVLQSLYRSWFSSGEFGVLNEVYKDDDYTALEQERVTATTGVTITPPLTYEESSEEYGDGTGGRRAPRELSSIEVVQDGVVSSYVWERTAWVEVNRLELSSSAPLAHYGDMGLAACFAMHYADTFGNNIGAGTKLLSDRFMAAMRARRNEANPRLVMEAY